MKVSSAKCLRQVKAKRMKGGIMPIIDTAPQSSWTYEPLFCRTVLCPEEISDSSVTI